MIRIIIAKEGHCTGTVYNKDHEQQQPSGQKRSTSQHNTTLSGVPRNYREEYRRQ